MKKFKVLKNSKLVKAENILIKFASIQAEKLSLNDSIFSKLQIAVNEFKKAGKLDYASIDFKKADSYFRKQQTN